MKITAPYFVTEEAVHTYDIHDTVEREGYVPNDKKIDTFIETGMLMSNMRLGGEEYEIQGEESEFEADSPEFRDELTADAENFSERPLEQYMDKITANEILHDADLKQEYAEKAPKKKKEPKIEDSVVKAITDGFNKIEKMKIQGKDEPNE